MELIFNMEQGLCDQDYFSPGNPGILAIEQQLLEIAATPELLQGLFYMLPIKHEDKVYVRLVKYHIISPITFHMYNIYTYVCTCLYTYIYPKHSNNMYLMHVL